MMDPVEAVVLLRARKRYGRVDGSPFQPLDRVRVTQDCDGTHVDTNERGESLLVGEVGSVRYLEYDCGCGQVFPSEPMIGVRFATGVTREFWPEELELAPTLDPARLP